MDYEKYEVRVYSDRVEWYYKGQRHRVDGPAEEWADGTKRWYYKGQLHREDGPAVAYANGDKRWYYKGQRHRVDGPAIEDADGNKRWYYKGQRLTEEEWQKKVNQANDCTGKVVEIEGKRYKLVEA